MYVSSNIRIFPVVFEWRPCAFDVSHSQPAGKVFMHDVQSESRGSDPELTLTSTSLPHAQLKTPQELKAAHISSTDVSSEDEKPKSAADASKAKQSRAKAALVKRARSVAVFSLRLRKAREAREAEGKQANEQNPEQALPAPILGGELNLIPIEKLIQMEDLSKPGN